MSEPSRPIIVEPARGWAAVDLGELWRHRELLYFFVWRDVKVRYKQTALGAAWAVLQPAAMMALFAVFFGRLVGVPSDGLPYPLFALTGLLAWTYFSHAVTESSGSLVASVNLLTKVYFPRLILPVTGTISGLVDLAIALVLVFPLLIYYRIPLSGAILMMPIWIALSALSALAVGLWLSALAIRYRDVRYTVPFLIQLWFFVTPVVYPSSIVPDSVRPLYDLNPLVAVVDGFRWSLAGGVAPRVASVVVAAASVFTVLLGGLFFFQRTEESFADLA